MGFDLALIGLSGDRFWEEYVEEEFMSHDQTAQHHRSTRLPHYDYSQPGWYFVTVCTHENSVMFGHIVDNKMCLNASGELIQKTWSTLPDRFPSVQLDAFVVMPNHIHGIIILTDTRG